MKTTTHKTEIKRNEYGDYEVISGGEIHYTISKGGTGWNIYEGIDVLRGWLDAFDLLADAKAATRRMTANKEADPDWSDLTPEETALLLDPEELEERESA